MDLTYQPEESNQNEQAIMNIIVYGGDARSHCLKALRTARNGQIEEAESMLKEANDSLVKAHGIQTELIREEIQGKRNEITLLMVHAQDHLMNALTIKDLCVELIQETRKRIELEKKIEGVVVK